MDFVEIIGFAAAMCTTLSFLPQALKTWKTRLVKDISLTMYLVLCLGLFLWLLYGLFIGSMPIIIANAVTLILAGSVLAMRILFIKRS